MDGARLARLRWRTRGAWMWPAFIVLTVVDAVIGHELPPIGDSQGFGSALLVGMVLNLLVVVLLRRPFGALLRTRRRDLPPLIAGDYGGTAALVMVSVALAALGVAHRPARMAGQREMADAITRAQAWIGDRAPAEFRRNLQLVSTIQIDRGVYRACVVSDQHDRTYCVIVKTALPFAQSVSFGGYEPNSAFSLGIN